MGSHVCCASQRLLRLKGWRRCHSAAAAAAAALAKPPVTCAHEPTVVGVASCRRCACGACRTAQLGDTHRSCCKCPAVPSACSASMARLTASVWPRAGARYHGHVSVRAGRAAGGPGSPPVAHLVPPAWWRCHLPEHVVAGVSAAPFMQRGAQRQYQCCELAGGIGSVSLGAYRPELAMFSDMPCLPVLECDPLLVRHRVAQQTQHRKCT